MLARIRIEAFPVGHIVQVPASVAPVALEYRPPPQAVQSHVLSSRPVPYVPDSHSSHCQKEETKRRVSYKIFST